MKKILLSLAAIISVVALAQAPKEFRNTVQDSDVKLCVNDAGTDVCSVSVDGTTGHMEISPVDSGLTQLHPLKIVNKNTNNGVSAGLKFGFGSTGQFETVEINALLPASAQSAITFHTSSNSGTTRPEKMRINHDGFVTHTATFNGLLASFTTSVDPADNAVNYIRVGESATSAFGTIKRATRFESGFLAFERSGTADGNDRRVLYFLGSDLCTDAESNSNHGTATCLQKVGDQSSDERIKSNIKPLEYGLSEVLKLKPIRYTRNDQGDAVEIGFSAQKTLSIVPEAVNQLHSEVYSDGRPDDPMDKLGMSYIRIIPVLVNAIQEQQAQIESLQYQLDLINRKLKDAGL